MAYNNVNAPVNDNNLEIWQEELDRWNMEIDLLEDAISLAKRLASGRNLLDELETAAATATRCAGLVSLKVGRLKRAQENGHG